MIRIRSHSIARRAADGADGKAAKPPRIRVAEAVEAGVEGLLLFLVRYIRTSVQVVFAPRATARPLLGDRHALKPAYVLPLTYLSIGLFLLSLLGQVAGNLFFDWIWFIDDIASKVTDALSKEVSLIKVAIQALPGVFVVALFAGLLRLMLRRVQTSRRMVPFVLSYAFGAQAFILFLVAFGFVILATVVGKWTPPWGAVGSDAFAIVTYLVLLGGLAAAFIGPTIFAFNALRMGALWRRRPVFAVATGTFLTFGLLFGHLVVLYATDLPTVVIERAKGATTPDVVLGNAQAWSERGRLMFRLDFLLHNRASKPNGWKASELKVRLSQLTTRSDGKVICIGNAIELENGIVLNATGLVTRFASLDSDQTQWFEITASHELDANTKALVAKGGQWGVGVTAPFLKDEAKVECGFLEPKPLAPAP
jgi:hypothetical protein